jgi:transcription initiation factor TFIID TATA-box-binding protein
MSHRIVLLYSLIVTTPYYFTAIDRLENIEYEPEQFPGLVYRMSSPKVVVLLFGSGKLVITGGKKPEDAEVAVEKIVIELDGLGLL